MATLAEYSEFFLNSSPDVTLLECIDLNHPSFSQTYHIVRNLKQGVTVQYAANPGVDVVYTYYPLAISPLESNSTMDQSISIQIGDLQGVLQDELDNVADDDLHKLKPGLIYRAYRSDDLAQELWGPIVLQVNTITFSRTGALIAARAPIVDLTRTGEKYVVPRFPTMRNIETT